MVAGIRRTEEKKWVSEYTEVYPPTSKINQDMDWSLYDGYQGAQTSKCNAQEEQNGQHFATCDASIEKRHP